MTFDQALTWAIRLAQFFKQKGLGHKDIIGIIAENSTFVMPLAVACLMNGTPFHAADPSYDEGLPHGCSQPSKAFVISLTLSIAALTAHVLSITRPSLIFCGGNVYEKVHGATVEWHPEIYVLGDPVEGVAGIDTLLGPTTSERFYQ